VTRLFVFLAALALVTETSVAAQTPTQPPPVATPAPASTPPAAPKVPETKTAPTAVPVGVPLPAGYKIGPDDVLHVMFWRDKDLTNEVTVRPDGRITLPLLNDVVAAGLTPEELRSKLTTEAQRYVEDPNVTVVVKQINSRRVFITGMVGKPGAYPLVSNMSVLQLISMAGGLSDYANPKKIRILRGAAGNQQSLAFNYKDVAGGNNLEQNVELKPGDTVVVP
jgi:polysaccharide export outer membrane protein